MTVANYLQFVVALLFVLALIGVATMLARRFGLAHAPRPASRKRRLAVEEILPLDGKRRLVLIRRDAVEHLVLLGANSEVVVERGVTRKDAFRTALREQVIAASHPGEPR